jgi:D-alanyl-D-alanine carboxypeptidase
MNSCSFKLGMANTTFDSPHGLQNSNNLSTAYDMAILSHVCM